MEKIGTISLTKIKVIKIEISRDDTRSPVSKSLIIEIILF